MTANSASTPGMAPAAAFGACSLIWGSTFLFISIGNDAVPPLWAAALRLLLAGVLLTAITLAAGQRLPRGGALRAAAAFGFLNFGLGFCLLYWGETTVPSGLAAVLYATIPLTTALFARAFGLERPAALKIAGAVVALGGVTIIFSSRLAGPVSVLPVAALFVAASLASVSGVVLKRGPRQPPLGANAVAAFVGFGVCASGSFLLREPHVLPRSAAALGPILYLTLAGSVVAFVLFAWLVNHWDVTRISFISVVVPLVALALGAAVRHERLTPAHSAGSLLVMAGLALAIASDRRRAPAAERAT
jgi:drug/metabolite transporter (DMT)-like permease